MVLTQTYRLVHTRTWGVGPTDQLDPMLRSSGGHRKNMNKRQHEEKTGVVEGYQQYIRREAMPQTQRGTHHFQDRKDRFLQGGKQALAGSVGTAQNHVGGREHQAHNSGIIVPNNILTNLRDADSTHDCRINLYLISF